ncbi:sulfotransferase family protein [Solimonas terrae]|uniref:Sulfotransferase n=1 Tax=Solimonas terrae TaxID=1396819 RepID=A0A6M2BQN7_9GAMM|nr:sulfotransferase [Solimonas terrae]NGY04525.1 sulfotransferase [Solimonas terrae]
MLDGSPFFIIGVPRSGTTLLRDLLARHTAITLPPEESQFLPDLIRARELVADDAAFLGLAKKIVERSNYAFLMQLRHKVSAKALTERLFCADPVAVLRDVVVASRPQANLPGTVLWGDKTPNYAWMAEEILKWAPSAKFVHIVRDPRDVAMSMATAWSKSALRSALDWRKTEIHLDTLKSRGLLHGSNLLELKYEDLLAEPRPQLSRICSLLGVNFEQSMLDLPASSERWGQGAGHRGVKSDNSGKFLQNVDSRTIRVVESICVDRMRAHGYAALQIDPGAEPRIPGSFAVRLAALRDAVRVIGAYVQEFGLFEGIRYKLRQRGVRALRRTTV